MKKITFVIDVDRCIGCKGCNNACPYEANTFNEELRVMDKCTICIQRREQGETPACVMNCCGGALHVGDSFILTPEQADGLLAGWKKRYRVLAPKLLQRRGADPVLRYQEIGSFSEICNERNSDFSAKEAYYPVSQTMLYFTDTEVKESGEHCFCVSMQSNVAEDYEMAVRLGDGQVSFHVKAAEWMKDFQDCEKAEFMPRFITENQVKVETPVIQDTETLLKASKLPYWEKFNDNCISCGGCNTVCPTCACFDTVDVIYNETSKDGERRRVWSSCMLDTFTMTAGGARAEKPREKTCASRPCTRCLTTRSGSRRVKICASAAGAVSSAVPSRSISAIR